MAIRPDTLDFIRRVVDPELHRLRETRDALARQLGMRQAFAVKRERAEHEGFLVLSDLARTALRETEKARLYGCAAAYQLLHANGGAQ
jgi:hypothetical protein